MTIATRRILNARFELGPVLGRGGMSEVRRATDTVLDRPVAVKLFRGELDRRSEDRFRREALILARLQHPNVVTVFDVGSDRDERFIVMELVEGRTLRQVLDQEGALNTARAARIVEPVAAALEFAHGRGIVHRDVKPSNVLLSPTGSVKLADLGIAKILTDTDSTVTTGVFGTFSYMAPEQARGEAVDGRADIYALGCLFFEMLAGRPPFEGDGPAVLYAHANEPAPSVTAFASSTPAAVASLVASMLDKDPAARPTASVVRSVLDGSAVNDVTIPRLLPGGSDVPTVKHEPVTPTQRIPSSRPAGGASRDRMRLVPMALGAAMLVIGGLFILATALASDETPTRPRRQQTQATAAPTERPPDPPDPSVSAPGTTAEEAGGTVLAVVDQGVDAGEITGSIAGEIDQKIDEILRELPEDDGVDKALDKIDELRGKVAEALAKGEISSSERAAALDAALDRFAAAIA